MYAILLLVSLWQPDVPPVDATRFGVTYEIASANCDTARLNLNRIVSQLNGDIYQRWNARQCYVKNAWGLLRDAMDTRNAMETRLQYLATLREWIGAEAYTFGRMPTPLPEVRVKGE